MIILLEGPDGGGKTQTAKRAFPHFTYVHNGPPEGATQLERVVWQFEGLRRGQPDDTAVDRSWPSEQIYHKFMGRPDVFRGEVHRLFDDYMFEQQGVIVLCIPSRDVCQAAWQKRVDEGKELLVEAKQFHEMYDFYSSYASIYRLRTPVVWFDYVTMSYGDLHSRIARVMDYVYDTAR